jgi:hypothetical protein
MENSHNQWCERGELKPHGVTHWILSQNLDFCVDIQKPLLLRTLSLISRAFFFLHVSWNQVKSGGVLSSRAQFRHSFDDIF